MKQGWALILGHTILVLESDKASMEIPTEDAGVIKKVFVSVSCCQNPRFER